MNKKQGGKGKKNVEASMSEGVEDARPNSVLGKYSETEMIVQLKRLALDPCNPQFAGDNVQSLQNQILRLRKIMVLQDSHMPWRKRKLEQFVKDKVRAPSDIPAPNQQNGIKLTRQLSHSSSISCLLNLPDSATKRHYKRTPFDSHSPSSLLTFDDTSAEKHVSECSFMDDNVVHFNQLRKDTSPIIDSDESVNGPNGNIDGDDDHQQRKVIPVGPRFQADVPKWTPSANRHILIDEYTSNSDNSKWLGTRIWPIEIGNMKTSGGIIGKGRPQSCCCVSSGSVDCVRRHILEKRLHLQCDLGPAFFSWKFDEMGEQASELWTPKERQNFESLVKMRTLKNFSKHALKGFSNKCWKDIVRYYFNVYIPQRMSLQTRLLSLSHIDTDDDEDDNVRYLGTRKRAEGRTPISNVKHIKARYLCRAS